ncbi:MAG TPA: nonribosomal peptide synthetase MxaA, partial [Methylophilaceae bacterium]|nr:nonribosomal peptide synthetase MxaA [Methylophilaceae bacterium]
QTDSAEHGKKTIYTITLSYQVFAYAGSPKVMQLPKQSFAVTGGPKALSLNIPAWGFWYSPLVANVGINDAKANLQPSQLPLLIDLSGHRIKLLVFAGLLVIGLVGLIYVNADRRWLPFMGGPFARAYRKIKRLPQNPAREKQALFYLHEAFNQTFGATLFARNVQQFISSYPAFSRLQADIQAFFEKSNKALFADEGGNAAAMNDLLALSKNLRNSERGI